MPVATLNAVVLPAPFGPISATSSPASTENEKLLSALRPPKRRETLSISSNAIVAQHDDPAKACHREPKPVIPSVLARDLGFESRSRARDPSGRYRSPRDDKSRVTSAAPQELDSVSATTATGAASLWRGRS